MANERVCVFCGSSSGARPEYAAAARSLGEAMAGAGLALVYGGSNIGLMRALADAVLGGGGTVTGVIPEHLMAREIGHLGLSDLRVVPTMHERKAAMADLANAFVALPGGLGTLEELLEILAWSQLGLHDKPVGLLNVAGYYGKFIDFLAHGVDEGFVKPSYRDRLVVDDNPARLVQRMVAMLAGK